VRRSKDRANLALGICVPEGPTAGAGATALARVRLKTVILEQGAAGHRLGGCGAWGTPGGAPRRGWSCATDDRTGRGRAEVLPRRAYAFGKLNAKRPAEYSRRVTAFDDENGSWMRQSRASRSGDLLERVRAPNMGARLRLGLAVKSLPMRPSRETVAVWRATIQEGSRTTADLVNLKRHAERWCDSMGACQGMSRKRERRTPSGANGREALMASGAARSAAEQRPAGNELTPSRRSGGHGALAYTPKRGQWAALQAFVGEAALARLTKTRVTRDLATCDWR